VNSERSVAIALLTQTVKIASRGMISPASTKTMPAGGVTFHRVPDTQQIIPHSQHAKGKRKDRGKNSAAEKQS